MYLIAVFVLLGTGLTVNGDRRLPNSEGGGSMIGVAAGGVVVPVIIVAVLGFLYKMGKICGKDNKGSQPSLISSSGSCDTSNETIPLIGETAPLDPDNESKKSDGTQDSGVSTHSKGDVPYFSGDRRTPSPSTSLLNVPTVSVTVESG